MKENAPRNKDFQQPTKSSDETVERLEEKKRDDVGKANKERIEDKEREVSSER
jgi:hypothetical protein